MLSVAYFYELLGQMKSYLIQGYESSNLITLLDPHKPLPFTGTQTSSAFSCSFQEWKQSSLVLLLRWYLNIQIYNAHILSVQAKSMYIQNAFSCTALFIFYVVILLLVSMHTQMAQSSKEQHLLDSEFTWRSLM